jgi:DNA polymerase-3 subunit epsilon
LAWEHERIAPALMPDPDVPNHWEQVDLLSFMAPPPEPVSTQPASDLEPAAPFIEPEPEPERAAAAPAFLLIVDTETTGLDPERDRCIEVGAILFDVRHRAVLSQLSFLLPCQTNQAQGVNGIAPELSRQPQPLAPALALLEAMVEASDLLVAHNAAFDAQWFGRGPLPVLNLPWLCSMEDIRWPAERQLRSRPSVRDLALAYGVPVWAAHRALTDCIYLAQVFERCSELEQLLVEGMEPRQLYRARLSYEERHQARDAGFRWNEPVRGAWTRRLSEREAALLPFPVTPVEAALEQRSA